MNDKSNKEHHLKNGRIGLFVVICLFFISIILQMLDFDTLAFVIRLLMFLVFIFGFLHSYLFLKNGFKEILKKNVK